MPVWRATVEVEQSQPRESRGAYHAGGVTQKQLAEHYGISQSYVSAIVRGELRAEAAIPGRMNELHK
jgi:predicted transcriptional regulator